MICFRDPPADVRRGRVPQFRSLVILVALLATAMAGVRFCARVHAAEKKPPNKYQQLDLRLVKLDERTTVGEIVELSPELLRQLIEANGISFKVGFIRLHRLLELNELATKQRLRVAAFREDDAAAAKALDARARALKKRLDRVTRLYNERLVGGDALTYHFVKVHYFLAAAKVAHSGSDRKKAVAELRKAIDAANDLIVSAKAADRLSARQLVNPLEAMRLRIRCQAALVESTGDGDDRLKAIQFAKEYSVELAKQHAKRRKDEQKDRQRLSFTFAVTPAIDRFFRWAKEAEATSLVARLAKDRKGERTAWKTFLEKADKQGGLKPFNIAHNQGMLQLWQDVNGTDVYFRAKIKLAELENDHEAASKASAQRVAALLITWKGMVSHWLSGGHNFDRGDLLLSAAHYCLARIDAAEAARRVKKRPK